MQKHLTAQSTIVSTLHLEFVDAEGEEAALLADFEYNPTDPYAVSILFKGEPTPVRWTFARDLLIEGFYEPTGDGDVHVWPCLSAAGTAVVVLELCSPSGEVLIQAQSREVSAFLREMVALVPVGEEGDQVDFDDEIAALLTA